jgi:hypothetical protein
MSCIQAPETGTDVVDRVKSLPLSLGYIKEWTQIVQNQFLRSVTILRQHKTIYVVKQTFL